MQRKPSYHLLFASLLVLILSGCQGQRSGVIRADRANSVNYAVTPDAATITTQRPQRGAFFNFQTTPQEAMQCQFMCSNGNCPNRCMRVFHDFMSRGFGPQYFQMQPQTNLFGSLLGGGQQGNSYVFDYNTFEMANTQWIQDYNQNLGQFHTMNNMNQFCQNPSGFIDESVNFGGCNNIDMNYLVGSTYANNAFNYYIHGQPQQAQQAINTMQGFKGRCPNQAGGCYVLQYGTPWGKRNIQAETAVIEADFKRSWQNLKGLPKNAGLRIGNGILNVIMTRAMLPVAQIEARLANMTAQGMHQLNYWNQMSALAYQTAAVPVYMTGGTCDPVHAAVNGSATAVSQDTVQRGFVIGQVDGADDNYIISCSSENVQNQ